jgi:hypothetical protein
MMLTHSLRKQTNDDDVLCQEIVKKQQKDIEVSHNVGTITAGLRSKKMNINNGQLMPI